MFLSYGFLNVPNVPYPVLVSAPMSSIMYWPTYVNGVVKMQGNKEWLENSAVYELAIWFALFCFVLLYDIFWYIITFISFFLIWWCHQMETFPRYWPFVRGIHGSPVNSPRKGQWRGALMFSLICGWLNNWVNNSDAGDLRRHRAQYDVTVMKNPNTKIWMKWKQHNTKSSWLIRKYWAESIGWYKHILHDKLFVVAQYIEHWDISMHQKDHANRKFGTVAQTCYSDIGIYIYIYTYIYICIMKELQETMLINNVGDVVVR